MRPWVTVVLEVTSNSWTRACVRASSQLRWLSVGLIEAAWQRPTKKEKTRRSSRSTSRMASSSSVCPMASTRISKKPSLCARRARGQTQWPFGTWGGYRFDFSGGSGICIGRRQRGRSQEPDAGPLNSMSISARDMAPRSGAVGAASFLLSLQAISSSTVQGISRMSIGIGY